MQEADLVYENGIPKLANTQLILDSRDLAFRVMARRLDGSVVRP